MKAMIILGLLLVSSFAFADVGPGPQPPSFTVKLMERGMSYTGDANVTFLCDAATERGPPENAVDPGDLALECNAGVCTNTNWYYKFNPCFGANGAFEVIAGDRTVTTGIVTIENGETYNIDIQSGAVTEVSPSICLPSALLLLLAAGFLKR